MSIFKFMNENMKTSREGLDLIAMWEGCVLKPYKDIAGYRTIGIGHLIKPGEVFADDVEITRDKAYELLSFDVQMCEDAIKKYIKVKLTQNQFDALISFGFNCGVGVYSKSGVASAVNSGKFHQVPARLEEWSKAKIKGVAVVVPGLLNRRRHEAQLFMSKENQLSEDDDLLFWNSGLVTQVQRELKRLGLYSKSVDGILGPGTLQGIESFSRSSGITVTDVNAGISKKFLEKLIGST